MRDGLKTHCKNCVIQKRKQYNIENRDKKREYYQKIRDRIKDYFLQNRDRMEDYYLQNRDRIKEYQLKNHDKIIAQKRIYSNNKCKSDFNFQLIRKTRRRIYKPLNGMTKQSSPKEILGIDRDLYRKWLEFQFTPEMNWSNIEVDHIKPICMFDASYDEQLKEAFSWKNTQHLLKKDHQLKGTKLNFLDYQLQFIKAFQFIKLNDERFNEDLH